MPDPARDRVGDALDSLAGSSSRRGFLSRLGAALVGVTAGGVVARAVKPGEADAYHFCGHIFTTGSCPHPLGRALPRIDAKGYPLRASDGKPIDNLGRVVDGRGRPVDGSGNVLHDPDGRPLPPAPRTKVCDETSRQFGIRTWVDGSWYRCCGGRVRKLVDCCAYSNRRINGDASLTGYCYRGRKVFCVMYFQTKVPC
ncbi:MAG TPA: hypothetical protein VK919_06015 [Solirubrobacterales bacterium]|nr:hypothetical protein [Solirubrobacterales bacterium]